MVQTEQIDTLVLDKTIWARQHLSQVVVNSLLQARKVGEVFPPIRGDKKTRKIVDGFHRIAVERKLDSPTIRVEWHKYDSDGEMFADSVRINRRHGFALSSFELKDAVARLAAFGYKVDSISSIVGYLPQRVQEVTRGFAKAPGGKQDVPLKRGFSHLAGTTLTSNQEKVNRGNYPGLSPLFYLRNVNDALENDMVRMTSEFEVEADRFVWLWSIKAPEEEVS